MRARPLCTTLLIAAGIAISACDRPSEEPVAEPVVEEPLEDVALSPPPMEIDPESVEVIVDKSAKVSVLGYHQFISSGSPGEMRIRVSKFREQMFALKEAGIPVISLSRYLEWRAGEATIPPRCVVITIDDGYNDIHSEALPIFKELGYPFTFYLYTKFLGGGGRTLSDDQVKELIEAGGELGSHSVSHDFLLRAKRKFNDEAAYEAWLEKELKGSKDELEKRFGVTVNSFAYPYGEYSSELAQRLAGYGYTTAVTVNGAKSGHETELMELPRYIIHGNTDSNWNAGTNFSGGGGLADANNLLKAGEFEDGTPVEPLVRVWPEDGAEVVDRLPTIWADLSGLGPIEAGSISLKVSGFGAVPATYDEKSGVVSWTVVRALRSAETTVHLSVRRVGESKADFATWSFVIDKRAYYLPDYEQRVAARTQADRARSEEPPGDADVRSARAVEIPE